MVIDDSQSQKLCSSSSSCCQWVNNLSSQDFFFFFLVFLSDLTSSAWVSTVTISLWALSFLLQTLLRWARLLLLVHFLLRLFVQHVLHLGLEFLQSGHHGGFPLSLPAAESAAWKCLNQKFLYQPPCTLLQCFNPSFNPAGWAAGESDLKQTQPCEHS